MKSAIVLLALLTVVVFSTNARAADEVDTAQAVYTASVDKAKEALVQKLQRLAHGHGQFGNAPPPVVEKAKAAVAALGVHLNPEIPVVSQRLVEPSSAKTWNLLPGLEIAVNGINNFDTGIILVPGMTLQIVPNPDDQWRQNLDSPFFSYKGGGNLVPMKYDGKTFPWMAMLMKVGDGQLVKLEPIVKGVGPLIFRANAQDVDRCVGEIRVKIVQLAF